MAGNGMVEIRVLGPVELGGATGALPLTAEKQRRLLAALVARAGEACPTDVLTDVVWGASPPSSADKLLQVYVSQLRKLLCPASIRRRGASYALELNGGSVDAIRFERLLEEGKAALKTGNAALAASLLRRGLELWRGRAYGEFGYDEFARGEAERLEELRLAALEARFEAELALGRHADLVPELCALAAEHPLREPLQAQAMLALYRSGRQSEALDIYRALDARLRDELGLEPSIELRDLHRRILQHDPQLDAAPAPQAAHALPVPPNRLIGRERELNELGALLRPAEVRMVVLTGAGGSGKTRLALEAARRAASAYVDGTTFVDLAPLRDPRDVLAAIATAVGVPEQPGDPLETLAAALRSRELLLVVDNVEHLREATPIFVQLLARAPRLTLLVTSRVVLHLTGEHVYPVEPLGEDAAVALFLQRAREADQQFGPDAEGEQAIRQICARLDRLPLAIELAATRIRALAPAELLARLEPRLPLLSGGPRDLPARQQTLRATLEWSLELLGNDESRDLQRLSVFAGGWSLEAAESVCETTLERVSSLVDHNLVRRAPSEEGSRYWLLETIREVAAELLDASPDADEMRNRHADYVLAIARGANLTLDSEGEQRFDVAIAEQDNIRAALTWFLRTGETAQALQLAVALELFWSTNSPREGIRWFEILLAADARFDPLLRVRALRAHGSANYGLGDVPASQRAQALWQDALAQARVLGDETVIASLLLLLANLEFERGANTSFAGDELDRAARLATEALHLQARAGDGVSDAQGLHIMGRIVRWRGELEAAHRLFEQGLAAARATRSRYWEPHILFELGSLERLLGRTNDAALRHRQSLPLFRATGDISATIASVAALARIARDRGELQRAGRLWGAVESTETSLGLEWALNRAGWERDVVPQPRSEFEHAREEGRGMSLDEAVAYALQPERDQ
jgi:predicted ATPase/DNA-binding SARP family transcriptional activator